MGRMVLAALLAVLMLVFPQITLQGASEGLRLWFQNVLPAQFPFMVCILLLMKNGLGRGNGSAPSLFLTGLLSGYPGGAKSIEVLYRQGQISAERLQWLMSFCNNSGPLFIVGTIGIGIFGSADIGYRILITHLGAAVICGCLFSLWGRGEAFPVKEGFRPEEESFGAQLGSCVTETASVMIMVGGFMMLYCVLIRLCSRLWPGPSYLYGLLEMTNGAARLASLPKRWSVPLVGALISMGGFCVYSQTCTVLEHTPFSGMRYLLAKSVQGILCGGMLFVWGILAD